jgi:hypothetical protein
MKNISDLRAALFAAIEGVTNGTLSLDQAKTVSELSQVIVNTAKVEVDYLKAGGGGGSAFIEVPEKLPSGILGVVRHRLEG